MTSGQIEVQAIAVVVAVACALPGSFLVLRRLALISDAISHSILLGIVLAFFVVASLSSPLLLVGAALAGLFTVVSVESLKRTGLVREDAAIGLVFPALFSVAVILISRYADSVHLDTDAVLLGELAFAPFDRFVLFDFDFGPKALVLMSAVLIVNVVTIWLFYKELKLATFDAGLALALGFSPALVQYGLMTLVSVTAVGAFNAVGSILVVALMIAPPATAYLLTDSLQRMLGLSALLGATAALGGYWLSYALDASIAGSMATVAGLQFGAAYLLAPGSSLIAAASAGASALGVRTDNARDPPAPARGSPRGDRGEPCRPFAAAPSLGVRVRRRGRAGSGVAAAHPAVGRFAGPHSARTRGRGRGASALSALCGSRRLEIRRGPSGRAPGRPVRVSTRRRGTAASACCQSRRSAGRSGSVPGCRPVDPVIRKQPGVVGLAV